MGEHDVVIVGAGPTGMMLAAELALAKVDVAVVERRTSPEVAGSRGGGLHARTIEVLDQRNIADRFLAEGKTVQVAGFGGVSLDISDFPTRHPYGLALWQSRTEPILAEWVEELGVPIYRGQEVAGFRQSNTGVSIELLSGDTLMSEYLVGCDGGRSLIRKVAGIEFPGWDPTISWLIAEAEWSEEPEWGFRTNELGTHALGRLENNKRVGIVLVEQEIRPSSERTMEDLKKALVGVYGTDFGVHNLSRISSFTDMTRQAAAYRDRRVLLAGDAAHIHPPLGGQGLNIGVQDAVNLGWKLAQVVKGISQEYLLDTYYAERHPVAARVLQNTMAQVALRRVDDRTKSLSNIVSEFLKMDEPRKQMAGEMSGLSIHYDLGEGHPLLGRRMPDLDLSTAVGPARMYELLHDARPVLLNLSEPNSHELGPWAERVRLMEATYEGIWELPVLGRVEAPAAVLVRPDGYVAWVGDGTDTRLRDALTRWFGAA